MTAIKVSAIMLIACLLALGGIAEAQRVPASEKATTPNPELVSKLTTSLNITRAQATGGAGAIFELAKSRLNSADFSKVAAAVPGMDGFLKAAPAEKGGSELGSLGSLLPGKAGSIGSLAGSFNSLGLSPAVAGKFVPIIQNYIGSKGGSSIANLFADALK